MQNQLVLPIKNILVPLANSLDASSTKRDLAILRKDFRNSDRNFLEIFQLVANKMPRTFLRENGEISTELTAVLDTLHVFALQQQAKNESVLNFDRDKVAVSNVNLVTKVKNGFVVNDNYHQILNKDQLFEKLNDVQQDNSFSRSVDVGFFIGKYRQSLSDVEQETLDKHFKLLVMSDNYEIFYTHLLNLLEIVKHKQKTIICLNYFQLVKDLYQMQAANNRRKVLMRWLAHYYN